MFMISCIIEFFSLIAILILIELLVGIIRSTMLEIAADFEDALSSKILNRNKP